MKRASPMKLASNILILVFLASLSSCRVDTPQATNPTSAETTNRRTAPLPTAEEVFHLRSECAQLAEKMLENQQKRDELGEDEWSQSSHYKPEENRCYVEIAFQTAQTDSPYFQSNDDLFDGQTGERLASVLRTGKNCPYSDTCKAVGTTPPEHKICTGCTSSEDAEKYITDKMNDPHD
jgi:hypothetical protein